MISKYIKELIPDNSRIIIPDFGAFMIQDTPNGKLISFNDFLKFNDSVLLNRIITNEKVDAAKGKEVIKAYVAEIEAAFKAGESFAVEGVGYLSKDGQSNIVFTQDENAKAKGKPKAAAKPKAEPKAEEVKPAAPAAEPKVEAPKPAPAPEVKPQPTAAPKPQPSTPQPAAAPKTSTYNNSYTTNKNMEIKTKNNKTLITVLIIVAALVIIGVLVWMAIDFNWFGPFKKAKEAPAPIEVVDTTPAIDTTAVVDTVEVVAEPEPVIVSEPVDPNSMRCHLIAGSFQVESNAIRFQEDMRSRGYEANIVTRNSGYYYVSIKSFQTRAEAVAEWRNMVVENPNLWILIK